MTVTSCRICASTALAPVLDLGAMPPVNYFLSRDELAGDAIRHPLRLALCQQCGLVMIDEVVPPEAQFRDYHYLTSASPPLVEHFAELARDCRDHGWVGPGTKVLDIGANDGTLLHELRLVGADPLGIDPSAQAGRKAAERGIRVLPELFGDESAMRLVPSLGRFDLITCTNVFAHTDDVKGFLAGISRLLAPDGIVIMEFAHLLDLVVKKQFDVIYHEHVSYFSLRPLVPLFQAYGLEIFDARKVLTQGGSLRIYVRRAVPGSGEVSAEMQAIREEEDAHGLHELATLRRFAECVAEFRRALRQLVADIRGRGQKIVGLGAPAKGVILLNYCGLGPDDIAYLVDSTELKQRRFLPGVHIPVYAEDVLHTDERPCDYFLLLAWNFRDALLRKVEPFRARGAKVIVPFPELRVI